MFYNCTIGYLFLIAISQHQKVLIFTYLLSIMSVNMVLFLYCHAGQCLYNESTKLSDSLYHSCWYNLNPLQLKHQLIFLTQSQICLRLTGKNICIFSYESFLNVIKSSMAYFSVLRKIL
ncbi:odorant receptor 85b-like [Trichogramma pretiosum]|uniref:odorant receptor 85b-like n=1 Tax=Trichogramma pretiosum TaxID=7493 RepID=UPI000C71C21A|nr:odorant receptor 85b-like [Trichogramma pretiosum]